MTNTEIDLLAERVARRLNMDRFAPRWLNLKDACAYMGRVSDKYLKGLIEEGHIYARQPGGEGGRYIVDRESIDAFLNAGRAYSRN